MRDISALQNAMRMQGLGANLRVHSRMGVVTGFDPNRFAIKAVLQPEGQQTGWLPLGSPWVGNGWGIFATPSHGDMVEVTFLEGNPEAGFATLRFFSDIAQALAVPSGELWIVHKKGGFFKLTNDGKVAFSDARGATLTLNGDGTITSAATAWNHTGNVNITGTVTASTDVVGGGKSLATHIHADPQGGSTAPPT